MKCPDCGKELDVIALEKAGKLQIGISRHHTVCWDFHPGECCCVCKNHYALYSHPWVNGLPTNHLIGWLCLAAVSDRGRCAVLSGPHGYCEVFDAADDETPGIVEQRECQSGWTVRPKTAIEIRRGA